MAKHILVVDAESHTRFPVAIALKNAGYKMSEAGSKQEALTMLLDAREGGEPFDLLCVSVRMPGMGGMELIYELEKFNISVPVLAISDFVTRELMTELVRTCCSDLLVKPFEPQELDKRVRDILESHEKGFLLM